MKIDSSTLAARITQGRGTTAADLVIKDVRLPDLVTGALIQPTLQSVARRSLAPTGVLRRTRDGWPGSHRRAGLHWHPRARRVLLRSELQRGLPLSV